MILVEVFVPALDQSCDVQLDETAQVGLLLDEMVEMFCRKEKRRTPEQAEALCLGWVDRGILLHPEGTLRDYGLTDGARLILV